MRNVLSLLTGAPNRIFLTRGDSGINAYSANGFKPSMVLDFFRSFYVGVDRRTENPSDIVTYGTPGLALMTDSDGLQKWNPHNLALNSATPATQSITVVSGNDYTVEITGTGSVTLSGAGTGTVTAGSPVEVTASTTTLTLTVAGSPSTLSTYRSDQGGMAPVPLGQRVAGSETYVPTTSAAVYLPRENSYLYDESSAKWNAHNLVTGSVDLSDTLEWIRAAQGTGSLPTVTANAGTAPDGTETATRLQLSRSTAASSDRSRIQQDFTDINGTTLTRTVWVKSFDGTDQVIQTSDSTENASTITTTVGSEWAAVTLEYDVLLGASGNFWIGLVSDGTPALTSDVLVWGAHIYRSDLNGVVPNSGNEVSGLYVPTTDTAVEPTLNAASSYIKNGLFLESEARTQLLHTTNALVTQSHTVTAVPHTLHFTGTGTVTLSGASTAGPLVGTGTGNQNRVSLTFTPTAASLTLTVTGTVSDAQLEVGSTPSSYIPNLAASGIITRSAETVDEDAFTYNATAMWGVLKGRETFADKGVTSQVLLLDWRVDANNRVTISIDTDGDETGEITLTMVNGGSSASVAVDHLSPGIDQPFSIGWRVSGSDIALSVDGGAAVVTSTTVGIPDLSAVSAGFEGMGHRSLITQGIGDVGNTGIQEISA